LNDEITKRLEILKQNDRKYKKVIKKIHNKDTDPLRELGPGISTYHQLLLLLMTLFMMLTLLHVPVMQIYDKYEFFKDENHSFIEMLSLGNMGFSKTECVIGHMQST
jgi:hypothetical protein